MDTLPLVRLAESALPSKKLGESEGKTYALV